MSAREIAYKILLDIEKNKNYSNLSINSHLRDSNLDDKERGFVTELVYGVIENRILIDYLINSVSKIKVKKMLYAVKIPLRMGVYQLIFLDGITDYAAINESVSLVKKKDRKSSNFVNAVLRNILRQKEELLKIDESSVEGLAIKYSYEKWIVERFVSEFGFEFAKDLLVSLSEKPNIYVRVNRLKSSGFSSFDELVDHVVEELKKDGISASRVALIEEALQVSNFKNIENNKMFKQGYISVQDISSMLVGKVLNPEKNSRVLDICAAPGGKSTHVCELLENTGSVVSLDLYEHKIKLINNYTKRLGITNNESKVYDALKLNEEYIEGFDYVICDAPCSGIGIVRRKPEIKYKKFDEIKGIEDIQYNILVNASKYVKKGGVLIYSTCTIFKEEDEDIVERFLKENNEFELSEIDVESLNRDKSVNGIVKILPNIDKMDGFFISKMKKR